MKDARIEELECPLDYSIWQTILLLAIAGCVIAPGWIVDGSKRAINAVVPGANLQVDPEPLKIDNAGGIVGAVAPVAEKAGQFFSGTELDSKWKTKKSAEFLNKTVAIAKDLGANPNYLMAIMQFESRLNHRAVNRLSNATGLIQFMPFTARGLGTSTSELLAMSEIQQLDYVQKYLMPYKDKLNTIGDFYAVVLWPAAVGKSDSYVLFTSPSIQYRQNNGFDRNRDGIITKAEMTQLVSEKLK